MASSTPLVSGGAVSIAAARRITRSGSSPARSPVSARIRVAIARAASAQAFSAIAACSMPASFSIAVLGLPSSSACWIAFQAAGLSAGAGPFSSPPMACTMNIPPINDRMPHRAMIRLEGAGIRAGPITTSSIAGR